jgi:hypothetical protein
MHTEWHRSTNYKLILNMTPMVLDCVLKNLDWWKNQSNTLHGWKCIPFTIFTPNSLHLWTHRKSPRNVMRQGQVFLHAQWNEGVWNLRHCKSSRAAFADSKGKFMAWIALTTLITTVVASMHAISCRTFCQSCSHGIDGNTSSIVQFILLVHSRIKSTVNQRPGSLLHHQSPKKSMAKGSVCWSCLRLSQHVTDTHLLRSEPWYRGVPLGFGQRWWVKISLQQHNIWCFCLFCCLQQVICQLYYLHHAPMNLQISELQCENLGQASNRWWRL